MTISELQQAVNPLIAAARSNDVQVLRTLLTATSSLPNEVVTAAAEKGNVQAVDFLLPYYTQTPSSADVLYDIPSAAITYRHFPLLKHMVDNHGAKIHSDDARVSSAIANGDMDIIRFMASRGFDVNGFYTSHFGGCLDQAIRKNNVGLVKFLLEDLKADPNIGRNFVGHNTPLRTAAQYDDTEGLQMLKLLFDHGAKLENCDALHDAVYGGRKEAVKLLLEKGADVNQVVEDASNEAPLMAAARAFGHVPRETSSEILKALLQKGADVGAKQRAGRLEGKTAVDVAREEGYTDAVDLLESSRSGR